MNKSIHIVIPIFILALCILVACVSTGSRDQRSYGESCEHCHGKKLQGVYNFKKYCGQCHDNLSLKPNQIKNSKIKAGVFNGIHDHKTDNIFDSTPSCYFCHRSGDF